MAKRRKKHSLTSRYQKACQAALRNRCVAWTKAEEGACIVNVNNKKVYNPIPKDLFDAICDVPYIWSVQLIVAGKTETGQQYTKGSMLQTQSRYYQHDLISLVDGEFDKLKKEFNDNHYISHGFVATPRVEDLDESIVEEILSIIGLWNNENKTSS